MQFNHYRIIKNFKKKSIENLAIPLFTRNIIEQLKNIFQKISNQGEKIYIYF